MSFADKITLYVYATSPYASKVAAVLHYKSLPFQTVHVNPMTRSELAFADSRIVPILRINNEWKQESTDIALWLEQKYPTQSILGDSSAQRSKILEITRWVADGVMPTFFRELVHWENYRQWLKDRWRYAEVLHQARPLPLYARIFWPWAVQWTGFIRAHAKQTSWDETLSAMRARILKEFHQHLAGGPFLGSLNQPSLADLALYPSVAVPYQIGQTGIAHLAKDPQVIDWLQKVENALPAHPFLISPNSIKRPLPT